MSSHKSRHPSTASDPLAQNKSGPANSDSDSPEVVSSSDEEDRWKDVARHIVELPSEYYHIQKLMKYIKAGNQTTTTVSLCCLKDYDLTVQINQLAIVDIGGLEVLVNLLECNDLKCRLGALNVLADISLNIDIRKTIVDLNGIRLLVQCLCEPAIDLKIIAAENIANVARVRLARQHVRKFKGIPRLVDLLDVRLDVLTMPRDQLDEGQEEQLRMARAGARALASLAMSQRNMEIMRKYGLVPLTVRLLKSVHEDVVIPLMATCALCASLGSYRLAITTENMIPDIVRHLRSTNTDLKQQCSSTIFKCGIDKVACSQVREAHGLEPLVDIIKTTEYHTNKPLIAAASGALWKCAASNKNVKVLSGLSAVSSLVGLLHDEYEDEDVLTNVVGAIAECCRFPANREILRQSGGLPPMVNLLNGTHAPLLENLSRALTQSAQEPASMRILEELDAVRLIWSLLKNPAPRVQAYAAFALCPCIENAYESGELVRSLVGAMELLVRLLSADDVLVLAGVCAAIATIAKDMENLAILTDHRVINKLAELVNTKEDILRENLAAAIASCAPYRNNTKELSDLRTVTPIVAFMTSTDPRVHRTTAMALERLSTDAQNCITMHQNGVVQFLLEVVGSTDPVLQAAAAGCLKNIRELALHAEEYVMKQN